MPMPCACWVFPGLRGNTQSCALAWTAALLLSGFVIHRLDTPRKRDPLAWAKQSSRVVGRDLFFSSSFYPRPHSDMTLLLPSSTMDFFLHDCEGCAFGHTCTFAPLEIELLLQNCYGFSHVFGRGGEEVTDTWLHPKWDTDLSGWLLCWQ